MRVQWRTKFAVSEAPTPPALRISRTIRLSLRHVIHRHQRAQKLRWQSKTDARWQDFYEKQIPNFRCAQMPFARPHPYAECDEHRLGPCDKVGVNGSLQNHLWLMALFVSRWN